MTEGLATLSASASHKVAVRSPLLRLLAAGFGAALMIFSPGGAASQQLNAAAPMPNNGEDFFKPPANMFQLLYGYQTAPGSGEAKGSLATVTTDRVELRLDHRVDLTQQSLIALRSDLPLLAKNPITSSNPNGDYLYGLGDADTQAIFVYNFDARWAAGIGARVIAPTGGTLDSGKWQIMPIAGLRYGLPEVSRGSYFEPFARAVETKYQQLAAGAIFEYRASRQLVRGSLSELRYPHQFRRSCSGPDRALVSSARCQDRAQPDGPHCRLPRNRRSDHQGLPCLQLQSGTAAQCDLLSRPRLLMAFSAVPV